ncbi:MAG: endoribonuclease [Alphaproteobacteria bacterium HGW-Alphaproteobacteria-13]|jgi:reactive intermediate/imine deaminase|nr:MAG: endoribonuclease [Alphaproteobacteria bacterium HGW-Alphaproteobacteria-13]
MKWARLLSLALPGALICTTDAALADDPQFHARPGSAAPFSPAVRAGDFIFASGQIGAARDGTVPEAMADQARLAMDNVRAALELADASLDDVVKCTVMMADMTQWAEFNRVYVGYFQPGRLPARSAFGTNGLALGAGVEVECLAYKPLGAAQ